MIPGLFKAPGKPPDSAFGPSADVSTIVSSAATVVNDGTTTVTITMGITDIAGVAVASVTPVVTATGAGNTIGTVSASDAAGISSCTFKTTGATAHVVSFAINGVTCRATVTVTGVSTGASVSVDTSVLTLFAPSGDAGGTILATLTAKDGTGAQMPSGGLTVVIGHSGGTSVISISAVTDVGNGTYTAICTLTTGGTPTTMSGTIGGVSVTTTMPTLTVTTPVSVWREWNGDTSATLAALLADSTIWQASDDTNIAQVDLVAKAYGSIAKAMQYQQPDRTASPCSDYTITRFFKLPSNVAEVWFEAVITFESGFSTAEGTCAGRNPDLKLYWARTASPNSGAWTTMIGTYSTPGTFTIGTPLNGTAYYTGTNACFDGLPHVFRSHWKASDTAGRVVLNVDGVTIKDSGTIATTVAGQLISGVKIGLNLNKGPTHAQKYWWHRIRVYNSDPGWGF